MAWACFQTGGAMRSPREYEALDAIERFCGAACIALCLVLLYGTSQRLDAMDRKAAEQQAAEQAKAPEVDQFAELDAQSKHMVAFDQIKK